MKNIALMTMAALLTVQTSFASAPASNYALVNGLVAKMKEIVSANTTEEQKNQELTQIQATVAAMPTYEKIALIDGLVTQLQKVEARAVNEQSDIQGMLTFTGLTLAGFIVISLLPYNTKAGLVAMTATAATFGALAFARQNTKEEIAKNAAELSKALLNMKAALEAEVAADALN